MRARLRAAWAELCGKPTARVEAIYEFGVASGRQLERIELGVDQPEPALANVRHLRLVKDAAAGVA